MFQFRNRKISRDEFRARSKKRFNFLRLKYEKKKDLDHASVIKRGEKLQKK